MDKGSRGGEWMEVYTLGDTRMAGGLSISCNRMALTHSSMSSIKKDGKRLRRRK
jgi:hypothetical protein